MKIRSVTHAKNMQFHWLSLYDNLGLQGTEERCYGIRF